VRSLTASRSDALLVAGSAAFLLLLALVGGEWLAAGDEAAAAAVAVGACTLALILATGSTWLRWVVCAIGMGLAFLCSVPFRLLEGRVLGTDSYNAIFQTTPLEAFEFVHRQAGFDSGLVLLVLLTQLPACMITARRRSQPGRLPRTSATRLVLALSLGLTFAPAFLVLPDVAQRNWDIAKKAWTTFAQEKRQFDEVNLRFMEQPTVRRTALAQPDLLIVVGESLSRHHFSLYGYPRQTNERLAKWDSSLVRFSDVVSGHSHTAESLSEVFSNKSFPANPKASAEVSLISLLRAGGYGVTWLSNQNQYGLWDNPITRHAKLADDTRFFRKTIGTELRTDSFDHRLVDELRTVLPKLDAGKPAAVFLHGYAGHSDYCHNIPPAARREWNDTIAGLSAEALFGKVAGSKEELDCYDSAISYVTDNLADIVDLAAKRTRPTIVLFFSDHAENVLERTGHDSSKHSHRHLEIPFLAYFNDAARSSRPQALQRALANRDLPFELGDFYHSVIDLAGLSTAHTNPERSLFALNPQTGNRLVLPREQAFVAVDRPASMAGSVNVADYAWRARYALRAMPAEDRRKVCAHRGDTFFRFMEAVRFFECVEIDLTFEEDKVWVFHPPASNTHLPARFLLDQVPAGKRVWLDVKNLDPERLQMLTQQLTAWGWGERKSSLLIETDYLPRTAEDQSRFRRHAAEGWHLSYYLPTERGAGCANASLSASSCRDWAATLKREMKQGGFSHLSFDAAAWKFVRDHEFNADFQIGTWDISGLNFEQPPAGELFEKASWFIRPFASPYYH